MTSTLLGPSKGELLYFIYIYNFFPTGEAAKQTFKSPVISDAMILIWCLWNVEVAKVSAKVQNAHVTATTQVLLTVNFEYHGKIYCQTSNIMCTLVVITRVTFEMPKYPRRPRNQYMSPSSKYIGAKSPPPPPHPPTHPQKKKKKNLVKFQTTNTCIIQKWSLWNSCTVKQSSD